jgi:uncharacterized membrane protein
VLLLLHLHAIVLPTAEVLMPHRRRHHRQWLVFGEVQEIQMGEELWGKVSSSVM